LRILFLLGFLVACRPAERGAPDASQPTARKQDVAVPSASAERRAPDASPPTDDKPRVAVLGGHLLVPATGEHQPGFDAVMSRVILEPGPDSIGPADFAFDATELHVQASGDVLEDARRASPDRTRVEPGPVANGIRIAWTYDETPWNGITRIPILAPVLIHPDGTVQRIEFFVGPRLAAKRDAYAARARTIVEGIAPGPPLATGPATVEVDDGVVIDVPKGYWYVRSIPLEHQVRVRIERMRRIGESLAILSIHAGPSGPKFADLEKVMRAEDPDDTIRTKGVLLGQKIEWASWSSGAGGERSMRAWVLHGGRRFTVHVTGANTSEQRALRAIAETLRSR
jgi:hypothetical protein